MDPRMRVEGMQTNATTKWVYAFGTGYADGAANLRDLLGGKGANLAEMSSLGLPVPPGFTITTEACSWFYAHGRSYPDGLEAAVKDAMARVEGVIGARFGDPENPLLVSVRSGARASMPGMMDTVLNLGLNDYTVEGLAKRFGDERFAFDSYRRFIQMYGNVVLGIDHHHFEDVLDTHKRSVGIAHDTEMKAADWRKVIAGYWEMVLTETGSPFPQCVHTQLWGAIGAVFGSWMNPRAVTYRRLHSIPQEWGTAINIQAMVFGNMGTDCCTGVAFTRNPSTGENSFYGEFLINAQGEDVVAGIRTPQHLTLAGKLANNSDLPAMEEAMPDIFLQLDEVRHKLEQHYKDMQDIEFTVQSGKLYMLQTRGGKRTAQAALRIAVEMAQEGLIEEREAVTRVDPHALDQLLHPTLDPTAPRTLIARGLPASPGAASGRVVFSAEAAEEAAQSGEAVILCRAETSPDDIHGMHAARGILTSRGGMTSHAAVVARGMGRPCVAGAGDVRIDSRAGVMQAGSTRISAGDIITIDGSTGQVFLGGVPMVQPELSGDFAVLMDWADRHRTMRVRANAETEADARTARRFGADGIGLCRTEHMFFDTDRIPAMREMIIAETEDDRRKALAKLEPMQRRDFASLFHVMSGLPVTIRLLDPPFHEFLPHSSAEIREVAKAAGVDEARVRQRANQLRESNPMLGHRGCRLGISYPEIYEMQARAIFDGALDVVMNGGQVVAPEIMIPLVITLRELELMKAVVDQAAAEVFARRGRQIAYMVGTMIELPRAALRAGDIAVAAEFFSFGTNDLTQTTLGISRDDAASFMPDYQRSGIFDRDPFASLDQEGVGELVMIAAKRGREVRPNIKLGICGEHGGDPASIAFWQKVGLDYISCSPYRVPIARLAAAQAALRAHPSHQDRQ